MFIQVQAKNQAAAAAAAALKDIIKHFVCSKEQQLVRELIPDLALAMFDIKGQVTIGNTSAHITVGHKQIRTHLSIEV